MWETLHQLNRILDGVRENITSRGIVSAMAGMSGVVMRMGMLMHTAKVDTVEDRKRWDALSYGPLSRIHQCQAALDEAEGWRTRCGIEVDVSWMWTALDNLADVLRNPFTGGPCPALNYPPVSPVESVNGAARKVS